MSRIWSILIVTPLLVNVGFGYFCPFGAGDGDYQCSDGLSCCYCNNPDSGGCLNDGLGGCGPIPTYFSTSVEITVVFDVSTVYSGTSGYAASVETQYYGSTDVVEYTVVQTSIVDVETEIVLAGTVAGSDVTVTARGARASALDISLPTARALVKRQDDGYCTSAVIITSTEIQTSTSVSYVYLEASVGTVSTQFIESDATSTITDVVIDSQTSVATVSSVSTVPGSTRTVFASNPSTSSSSPTFSSPISSSPTSVEPSTDDTGSGQTGGVSPQQSGGNSQSSGGPAASPTDQGPTPGSDGENGSASSAGSHPTPTTTSQHNGPDVGAIAGGVVGGLLGLAAILGAILLYWLWKKRQARLWPADEESKHDRHKKKKKPRRPGTTSILFIPGSCHTAFHLAPALAAFQRCGARVELPDEDDGDDDESSTFMPSTDYARSVAAAWKAAVDDPRMNLHRNNNNASPAQPRPTTTTSTTLTHHRSSPAVDASKYTIFPLPLYGASRAPREPRGTFERDVQHVVGALVGEATGEGGSEEMCVIAHGMAGAVVGEAVRRFWGTAGATRAQKAKLTNVVVVAGVLSSRGVVETETGVEQGWMSVDEGRGCMGFDNAGEFLFHDVEGEEEVRALVQGLVAQWGVEVVRGLRGEGWRAVPGRTFVVCERDQILGVEYQLAEANLHGMDVVRMDAGHCAFISQPDTFVETIAAILRKGKRAAPSSPPQPHARTARRAGGG